jgi:hypothetical protein
MEALLSLSLNLISKILPQIPILASPIVSDIIKTVSVATPIVMSTYKDLKPIIANIIKGLKNSGNITEDDWNTLIEAEKLIDEDFDKAATAVLAEDETAKE